MLLDLQGYTVDLNLLGHARRDGGGSQAMPARGAEVQVVVVDSPVDAFGWEHGSFVFGVSGLSAGSALVLALGRWRLGRLDDVGGWGLGGRRGILERNSELLL
jgi:hypothetical protein